MDAEGCMELVRMVTVAVIVYVVLTVLVRWLLP